MQGSGGDGSGGATQGTGGQVGTGGATQGTGGSSNDGGPTQLPTASNCPKYTNGGVVNFARASGTNVPVTIYIDANAKSKPDPGGPLVIYWHATLSSAAEVHQGFTDPNIQKVTSMGGVVAAPTTTQCPGCTTTDDGYWFVEDDVVLDQIVACAIQQANIDTRHIHTLGWSAGGLHTCHVGVARSNYIASIISYSGGYAPWPGTMTPEDPSNHVASILTYGTSDAVVVDFPTQSKQWYSTFQPQGYYTMMCKHQGGHEIDPLIAPLSLKFFMDHPYKVSPDPYATTIPSDYPNNALTTQCANSPL
jgi:predicted esterase